MKAAIVVGCSDYEHPIPSLRYASADAERFAAVLESTCGVPPENIWLLNNAVASSEHGTTRKAPTYTNLLRTVTLARGRTPPKDLETLFFFFSGHGYHGTDDATQYLLMSDSVGADIEHTAISLQTLMARLSEWKPRHLVMFVDACREPASSAKGTLASEEPGIDVNALLPAGNIVFSSCSPRQRSYEHQHIESGIFTRALCEGLSDIGRCRTLYELDAYLTARVPELCRLYDKPIQRPLARLEPREVMALEIVSEAKRNEWRRSVSVGAERRTAEVPRADVSGLSSVVAIDFGTCNTLARVVDGDGRSHPVPGPDGQHHVPSVVSFDHNFDYVVGAAALEFDVLRPDGTVRYPKRRLGEHEDFTVFGKSLPAEFVSSLILRHVKQNCEQFLGANVTAVVAAYPASFTLAQVNGLRRAFDSAGLEVMRFVPEPSVDGFHAPETVFTKDLYSLVVDLGGGTLDVAVLEHSEGVVVVEATQGNGRLGGVDYDEALEARITQLVRARIDGRQLALFQVKSVQREAERAKRVLSSQPSCDIFVPGSPDGGTVADDIHLTIDRDVFDDATGDLNRQLLEAVESTVREFLFDWRAPKTVPTDDEVKATLRSFAAVVLCGQGTRIPSLLRVIRSVTEAPIVEDFQNDAVVLGLAHQVGVLIGRIKSTLLIDNLQSGIGVLTDGRVGTSTAPVLADRDDENTRVLPIVDKGMSIPAKRSLHLSAANSGRGQLHRLRIVELKSPWPDRLVEHLGVVECVVPAGGLELTVDVDANSMYVLRLADSDGTTERAIVLNRSTPPPGMESIVDQRLTGSLEEADHTVTGAHPPVSATSVD